MTSNWFSLPVLMTILVTSHLCVYMYNHWNPLVIDILIAGQEVKWSTGVDCKQEFRQPGQLQKLQMDRGMGVGLPRDSGES